MAIDRLQHVGIIRARAAYADHVLLGERRITEQNTNHVGVGIAHDALNQRAVVRAREGLALTECEWTCTSEIRNAWCVLRERVFFFFFLGRHEKVCDMMKLSSSCGCAQLGSPRLHARLEQGPTQREKHRLRIRTAKRRAPMCFVQQSHAVVIGQRFEALARQAHAHVDPV